MIAASVRQSMIGEETPIEAGFFNAFENDVTIKDVGGGIVIVSFDAMGMTFTAAVSSCKIQYFGRFD
ncbi:hypothetical protein VQL36_16235 [Chengkuizengella sp. SCS-71B]|uniref:hypothetical protein n=1 Tax=Chengkuizengella sp. SCS-71B TaxID=3115290 RepID=UPI0032C24627